MAFGEAIRKEFVLEPDYVHLNHGTFGRVPKAVFELRLRLLSEIQAYPEKWYKETLQIRWDKNIKAAANFLNTDPENLVFVQNTTTGINCILKTLGLHPGDAILLHSWQHAAVEKTSQMTARLTGCKILTANLKLPINSKQEIIDSYQEMLEKHSNIKVVVLELINPKGIVFPINELTAVCKKHKVMVVVDGAHGPGQLQLNLEELGSSGVDCFVGSLHKWLFTPMGCAILWVHPRLHTTIRPVVTSFSLDSEKPGPCFCFQGTRDDTPFYTVKAAIAFVEKLGGMEAVVQYNKNLLDEAVAMLVREWNTSRFPIPPDMEAPCIRMVKMPYVRSLEPEHRSAFGGPWMTALSDRFNIIVGIANIQGETYVRLSCNIYNTQEDYQKLMEAVKTLVKEEKSATQTLKTGCK